VKRVIVHIDRLVLRGVRPADRDAVATSLTRELGASLADRGAATRLAARDDAACVNAGRVSGAGSPTALGRLAARGIARRITS
jgi:hypothetical protein